MTTDCELLRDYADEGDQAAFAEIVRRHVNWVYSTARRLVAGDPHLAEDITQTVFTDLARKAAKLSHHEALGGWLHTATRFAAAKAVDREQRRRAREQEAYAMQTETTTPEICWEQLRPALDAAIGRLPDSDRNAVVMRFFEGKSHREIGDAAGLSEDSARKRVDRAVEKLRAQFTRGGITVSAGLLAETMGANSVQAAPVALAETITGTALANAGASTGILYLLLKPLLFMTTTTKVALAAVVIVTAAASFHYVTNASAPSAKKDPADNATNGAPAVSPVKTAPQVAMPQAAPAPVSPTVAAQVPAAKSPQPPIAVNNPANIGTAPPASTVDPKTQDAMAMMQPMKALYGEIYSALMETEDPDAALQKLQELQPQLDALQVQAKGTNLEQILTPVLAQFKVAKSDLEHGDIAGAKKIISSINQIGEKTQSKIETTAGISIDQAAASNGPAKNTGQN